MFGAIAGGIASALAGGAMSKLFGGGQKAASGGIEGDVLATDNNTVGMGDAGIKSAIHGSKVSFPARRSSDLLQRGGECGIGSEIGKQAEVISLAKQRKECFRRPAAERIPYAASRGKIGRAHV